MEIMSVRLCILCIENAAVTQIQIEFNVLCVCALETIKILLFSFSVVVVVVVLNCVTISKAIKERALLNPDRIYLEGTRGCKLRDSYWCRKSSSQPRWRKRDGEL